jgi:hypothetical protein
MSGLLAFSTNADITVSGSLGLTRTTGRGLALCRRRKDTSAAMSEAALGSEFLE